MLDSKFQPADSWLTNEAKALAEANRKKSFENRSKLQAIEDYSRLENEKDGIITNDLRDEAVEKRFEILRQKDYAVYLENEETVVVGLLSKSYIEQIVILEKAIEKEIIDQKKLLLLFESNPDNVTKLAIISVLPKLKFENSDEKQAVVEFLKNVAVEPRDYDENNSDAVILYGKSAKQQTKEDWQLMTEAEMGEDGYGCERDYFSAKAIQKISEMGDGWEISLLDIFMRLDSGNAFNDKSEEEKGVNHLNKFPIDERGNVEFDWDRDFIDENYWYKRLVLKILAEKKSKKGIDFSLELLKSDEKFVQTFQREINSLLKSDKLYALERITESFRSENLDEKATFRLITTVTDVFGELCVRDIISSLIVEASANKDEKATEKLKFLNSFNTPNLGIEMILNLRNFYQTKIKFENYKINERMNEKEVALLQSLIGKDEKVLEMGCGTGRLISELAKSGRDISGYDYTQRHVQITKKTLEENNLPAKVVQGDWHNNALLDESFDCVYSLGRNILHDYSVLDQVQLFKEAARILKPGGQFIFDIPAREKATEEELTKFWENRNNKKYELEKQGILTEDMEIELENWENEALSGFNGYEKMVLKYGLEMKKRGIDNFRFGAIYDSPDGENFATRYAYCPEDIQMLVQMFGFSIKEVKKTELATGKEDQNLYYVLEKKEPQSFAAPK